LFLSDGTGTETETGTEMSEFMTSVTESVCPLKIKSKKNLKN